MWKKNLIVGIIKDYDYSAVEPFMVSLKKSGYKGDTVLFFAGMKEPALSVLCKFNVILVPFRGQFPYYDADAQLLSGLERRFAGCHCYEMPVNTYRYIIWYLYLAHNWKNYEKIMLTDVRDVVFQREPFDFPFAHEISCFIEDERKVINDCGFNSAWIRNVYGECLLDEIGNHPPSCCGVTIGTARAVMLYLALMVGEIARVKTFRYGDDTAIHNYLVYTNKLKGMHLYKNESGPVITLVNKSRETIRMNRYGRVINQEGKVVNIVHQYDRYPELAERIFRKNRILGRARRKILSDHYFWEVGYDKYFLHKDYKNAFKFLFKGLSLVPFDREMYRCFYWSVIKRL